jgi:hypothetical protein
MLNLVLTTDKLQVVTSAATAVDVHASGGDLLAGVVTPWKQNTAITTAVTTDIVASPAANTSRNVKYMTLNNKDTAVSNEVSVLYNANATTYELAECLLGPGEALVFREGLWYHYDQFTGIFSSPTFAAAQLLTTVEPSQTQRVLHSDLPVRPVATAGTEDFILISGTAYYVYVGRLAVATTIKFVEFHVTVVGAGAQTAEVGLFSTPLPPGKAAQTVTKLVATGTLGSLTATGVVGNTSSLATSVAANTHLWAAIRTAMATTQPKMWGLTGDYSEGKVLTTTGGGALTGLTTASGLLVAIAVGNVAPDLHVTLD